jgi:hypothetical protein
MERNLRHPELGCEIAPSAAGLLLRHRLGVEIGEQQLFILQLAGAKLDPQLQLGPAVVPQDSDQDIR